MASPSSLSAYESSDEASESDVWDQSLSKWKGWSSVENEAFSPIPLDIYTASSIGQYECVSAIVQKGDCDLNKPNKGGWTPLMYACYIGHDNIVTILLDVGVNVNVKNTKGQRALHLACSCGNESVVYFLLQAEAELEGRDRKGWTALFHATYSGHQNMVKFLLDHGADAEAREPHFGFTPFMEAAAAGHEIIVQYFLLHGIDVNAKALSGHTARSLALDNGHTKIVSLIDNHNLSPFIPLRSDAGLSLDGELGTSDDGTGRQRRQHLVIRTQYKGPSIRDGPDAFNKMIAAKKRDYPPATSQQGQNPKGYLTFQSEADQQFATNQIRLRDVTAPISPDDHPLEMSGITDVEEDSNAFTKTGALTIKSSSSSSGGLMAVLGLSQDNSIEELDERENPLEKPTPIHNSQTDLLLVDHCVENQKPHQWPPGGDNQNQDVNSMNVYSQFGPQLYGFQQEAGCYPAMQNPLSLFSLDNKLSQDQPMSMLQHPLWQPQSFGNLPVPKSTNCQNAPSLPRSRQLTQSKVKVKPGQPTTAPSPHPPSGHGDQQVNRGGLTEAAAAEQDYVFETRPRTLDALMEELGLSKYMTTFQDQDVDLQVFLSLTDNDLKEVGIKLFGPRRKMTNAIARWHSNARPSGNDLEQAYADKLEADMQEMAIQLKLAKEESAQYKHQIQQEQELRSVTESCLVNDRVTWQHIMSIGRESQDACCHLHDTLGNIRHYMAELYMRSSSSHDRFTGSGPNNSLAAALKDGLLLEDRQQPIPVEITKLTTQQLFQHLDCILSTVESLVAKATHNTEKLLDICPSSLPGYT